MPACRWYFLSSYNSVCDSSQAFRLLWTLTLFNTCLVIWNMSACLCTLRSQCVPTGHLYMPYCLPEGVCCMHTCTHNCNIILTGAHGIYVLVFQPPIARHAHVSILLLNSVHASKLRVICVYVCKYF